MIIILVTFVDLWLKCCLLLELQGFVWTWRLASGEWFEICSELVSYIVHCLIISSITRNDAKGRILLGIFKQSQSIVDIFHESDLIGRLSFQSKVIWYTNLIKGGYRTNNHDGRAVLFYFWWWQDPVGLEVLSHWQVPTFKEDAWWKFYYSFGFMEENCWG